MKLSNAQLATAMLAAYQGGDEEAFAAMVDPKVEVHGEAGLINAGDYHGLEGFRRWVAAWEEAWEEPRYEIARMSEIGDEFVVAAVRVIGTGRGSGIAMKDVYGWLWQFRDGRAVRFHAYVEHKTALRRAAELAGGGDDEPAEEPPEPQGPPAREPG